jgi:hypothetical protein
VRPARCTESTGTGADTRVGRGQCLRYAREYVNACECTQYHHLLHVYIYVCCVCPGYALPPSCALHPERDMLLEQEHTKKVVRRGQWQCEACGRHFVSEEWIDLHMDRRHIEDFMLANPSRDVCLADYCPVFQCQDAGARSYSQAEYKHSQCDAAEMARLQRKCSALLLGCFPYEQVQGKGGMTSLVLDSVCGMLTCDEGQSSPPQPLIITTTSTHLLVCVSLCVCMRICTSFHNLFSPLYPFLCALFQTSRPRCTPRSSTLRALRASGVCHIRWQRWSWSLCYWPFMSSCTGTSVTGV